MTNVGCWTMAKMERCALPEKVESGFKQVVEHMVGAAYTPVLYVGQQLVHGENYMIICTQKLVVAEPVEHLVQVVLHWDENGWAILSIDTIC